jgi:hypothetical protein
LCFCAGKASAKRCRHEVQGWAPVSLIMKCP